MKSSNKFKKNMEINSKSIALFLEKNNITYEKFARECGVAPNTVYRWISGQSKNISRRNKAAIKMVMLAYNSPTRQWQSGINHNAETLLRLMEIIVKMNEKQRSKLLKKSEEILKNL